jgi:hypothetical protein
MDINNYLYQDFLKIEMKKQIGINANTDLKTCIGSNNDTVLDCPVYGKHYKEEFIVIVHN